MRREPMDKTSMARFPLLFLSSLALAHAGPIAFNVPFKVPDGAAELDPAPVAIS